MQKRIFQNVNSCCFLCFYIFNAKKVKKKPFTTAAWHAQNTNAGQNIQHKYGRYSKYAFVHVFWIKTEKKSNKGSNITLTSSFECCHWVDNGPEWRRRAAEDSGVDGRKAEGLVPDASDQDWTAFADQPNPETSGEGHLNNGLLTTWFLWNNVTNLMRHARLFICGFSLITEHFIPSRTAVFFLLFRLKLSKPSSILLLIHFSLFVMIFFPTLYTPVFEIRNLLTRALKFCW